MIPTSFEYKRAQSVEEALSMLGDDAQVLGGGHSLIPALKLRLNAPGTLVDISKISALQGITDNDRSITIGAGATHAAIAANADLATHCPMMGQAAREIGDIQVRNKGTIGGSIAHADPAADWPAALLAANAQVTIHNKDGRRTVDIDQFFKGFYETAVEEGEIITSINIPKTAANQHSTYVKFKQPASRFALVGCAAAVEVEGGVVKSARIGITGVGDSAYRAQNVEKALVGKALNAANIEAAVTGVTDGVDVMSDHYASEAYRTHLAHVFVKRALKQLI
ncbi:MAG: xanthine dehydrogenase family protein subunit M [Phaeodactylibacter sp.]|nr:xanthine dehydrogenase family protein subunit M [Phaeodactylibacter sp.]